ncbi:hypothetical protein K2173_005539 [Erythroxylum novogranatense]|uniref:Uncharacterized protein n=1 Tax=Erythroxylum novogranatense TaxID=1862640 RepID=A0AAV8SKA1_9ROSI|nr:hypothetical protein K2173_005539 [Erythroxylum novogranatense]
MNNLKSFLHQTEWGIFRVEQDWIEFEENGCRYKSTKLRFLVLPHPIFHICNFENNSISKICQRLEPNCMRKVRISIGESSTISSSGSTGLPSSHLLYLFQLYSCHS